MNYPAIQTTPLVDQHLIDHAPVAIGASGGEDSDLAAFLTRSHLREIGHKGPQIIIHSDLGRVEHRASLPQCQMLADRLGLELVVVRRQKGDLMDRWKSRWEANVQRYTSLFCVKVILPWSMPSMRFCTSELKTAVICRYLVERFPRQTILNVVGLRAEESPSRAAAPVAMPQLKLTSKTFGTTGYNWHPILPWTREQVVDYHQHVEFPLHPAYTVCGNTRVSCINCIMGSWEDQIASTRNPENHDTYREEVDLEILSAFSFLSNRWLGDAAPHLLSASQQAGLKEAKKRAKARAELEVRIPKHLEYKKGWPTVMPSIAEARLLAGVRRGVADVMNFSRMQYTDEWSVVARYEQLNEERGGLNETRAKKGKDDVSNLR